MRFFKYFFYFYILLSLFVGYKFRTEYYPRLLTEIKKQAYEKWAIELDFSSIQFKSLTPVGVRISDIKATKKGLFHLETESLDFEIENLLALLQKKSQTPVINIKMNDFDITLESPANPTPSIQNAPPSTLPFSSLEKLVPQNPYITDVSLSLALENGFFNLKKAGENYISAPTKKLNIELTSLKQPVTFLFDGDIKSSFDNFELTYPLSITSQLKYQNDWIEAKNTVVKFIGAENKLSLRFHLGSKYIDLASDLDVPNLNQLPISLIENFPLSRLMGSLKSNVKVTGYLEKNPLVKGDVDLKVFSADLALKRADIASSGNFNLSLKTNFEYLNKLIVQQIKWSADFSKVYFEKTNLFKKTVGIPLVTEGSGSFKEDFQLDSFKLKFANVNAEAQGLLSLDKSSQFSFDVKEFDFTGFEKYLLMIPQYPISGKFAAKGEVQGALKDPKNLNLNLSLIKIAQLKYTLYKKINDVEVEGPIKADFQGSLHVNKQVALKGDLKGRIDADSLDIKKNGDSLKVSDDPLHVELKTSVLNQKIQIETFDIKSLFGHFHISGKPPIGFNDPMNINLKINKINWLRIRNFLPKIDILNGIKNIAASGNINIMGSINEKDLLSSPLLVTGATAVAISEIHLPWDLKISSTATENASETETKLIVPEPFVPQKDLLSKIKFSNTLQIDKITLKDKNSFENIQLTTKVENNQLLATGFIKKIFNGQLNISSLSLPLTVKDPLISYNVSSTGIELSPMVSIFLPTYKDLIQGQASLQVQGTSHLPYSVNFKKNLLAKGDFNYNNGKLNALDLAKLVKEKLMVLPGVSLPQKIGNSHIEGAIKSRFELKNLVVGLDDFSAKSKKNEELQINGSLSADLQAQLVANIFLVDLPLKGDFINANKDSSGRVSFPLEIKGKLTEPQWSFVGNTLEIMTKKYAESEKLKLRNLASQEIEKKKKEAHKALQNEIGKQKNKLESEAKKAFDGLFK